MEGLGELFLGDLQLLLGFLELVDVAHRHHQGLGPVQLEGLGGDKASKQLAVAAPEGHFQVTDTALVQAFQQQWAGAGHAPQAKFGGRAAKHLRRAQADLLLERFVDLHQAAVTMAGDEQDVRALLEHRCELLFRQAQGVLGVLGFADVDHQAAHQRFVAVLDHADDVAHPQGMAIGADHPVVEAVVAPGRGFAVAVGLGPKRVFGVQDAAPEAGLEPFAEGVAEQVLGMG